MKKIYSGKYLNGIAISAVFVLFVFLMSACSPAVQPAAAPDDTNSETLTETEATEAESAEAEVAEAPADEPIELRMGWWGGQSRNVLYNDIADLYEKQNPNVTIVREFADWTDYWTKASTQVAGNNLPDITASVVDTLSDYAQRGAYLPLDPYIEAGIIDTSDWPESVLESSKVDGKIYMMPTGTTINAVVVNKTMIEEVGMEPPPFEMSYQEFADYLKELQPLLDEGVYGTNDVSVITETSIQAWILQKGYQIANEDGTDVGFPREVIVSYFEYWKDLYDAGVVVPIEMTSQPYNDQWADSWLAKGKVVFRWTNSNQLKVFQQYVDGDLLLIRQPTMPDGEQKYGEYLRPSALSMAANTEYPEEVAKFINFFVNDVEATKIFNAELGAVAPTHVQEALQDSVHPKDVLVFEHFSIVSQDLPYKMPDPKGTPVVLLAFKRAGESIRYGTPIEEAVDVFMAEASEAYKAANE